MRSHPPATLSSRHLPPATCTRNRRAWQCAALRSGEVRLNLARDRALLVAELQRSQSAGVQGHVGIDGVRIQTLAQHQHGFLVLVAGFRQERNVGGQSHVAGNLLPGKLKSIRRQPHVLAAAADGVGLLRRVVVDRARVQNSAHIAVALEDADRRPSALGVSTTAQKRTTPNEDGNKQEEVCA